MASSCESTINQMHWSISKLPIINSITEQPRSSQAFLTRTFYRCCNYWNVG